MQNNSSLNNSQKTQLQTKLSETHQRISISINEGQRVNILVLKQLPMRDVVNQISIKFGNEKEQRKNLKLILIDETDQLVDESLLAGELGSRTLLKLVDSSEGIGVRDVTRDLKRTDDVVLTEIESGEEFEILQFPAIIGRYKNNMTHSMPLSVDLVKFGKTVSGIHARLTRDNTNFYIENLTSDNRLVITRHEQAIRVVANTPEQIKSGDILEVGRVRLLFSARQGTL